MSNVDKIVSGMMKLFHSEKHGIIYNASEGFLSGIAKMPTMIYWVGTDFFDTEHRWRNQTDKIRLIALIRKDVSGNDVRRTVETVIKCYYRQLNKEQLEKFYASLGGRVSGGYVTNFLLVGPIVKLFSEKVITKMLMSTGLVSIISIGAEMTKSVYGSYDLQDQ
ncbi:hypothetical protein E05_34710 [Plautia stali symbiont]|nr:hypothetical protein E05_34710 [Plautia stali symbiont]